MWSLEATPEIPQTTDKINTEGYTATILWDLHDVRQDNRDSNNSIDRLAEGFARQWAVLMGYDPAPADPAHNRPTTITEFWNGLRAMYPWLANRLSAIYDENEITGFPAADLTATLVTNPPASIVRGNSFAVNATVRNDGQVSVGESNRLQFYLSDLMGAGIPVGNLTVPDLRGRAGLTAGEQHHRAGDTGPGVYHFFACTDELRASSSRQSEANNCAQGPRRSR